MTCLSTEAALEPEAVAVEEVGGLRLDWLGGLARGGGARPYVAVGAVEALTLLYTADRYTVET